MIKFIIYVYMIGIEFIVNIIKKNQNVLNVEEKISVNTTKKNMIVLNVMEKVYVFMVLEKELVHIVKVHKYVNI
jgi:hypothetical protein